MIQFQAAPHRDLRLRMLFLSWAGLSAQQGDWAVRNWGLSSKRQGQQASAKVGGPPLSLPNASAPAPSPLWACNHVILSRPPCPLPDPPQTDTHPSRPGTNISNRKCLSGPVDEGVQARYSFLYLYTAVSQDWSVYCRHLNICLKCSLNFSSVCRFHLLLKY